jgi:hypothetical protein
MKYEFHWLSNTGDEVRKITEENIRIAQESGHSPITFCHEGSVIVTLATEGPLQTTLVGNMKCVCGKHRGEIQGANDGSNLTFGAVEN